MELSLWILVGCGVIIVAALLMKIGYDLGHGRMDSKSSWLPIETAPRDGTEVIVGWWWASVWITRGAWYRDAAQLRAEGNMDFTDEDTGWWSYRHSVTQEQLGDFGQPTHWLPMPDLPPEEYSK